MTTEMETENLPVNKARRYRGCLFLSALFIVFPCLLVSLSEQRYLEMHSTRLILTEQGCGYLKSLGMNPERQSGNCTVVARHDSSLFGREHTILLDDDRFVTLSADAVLATANTDRKLPDTPKQRHARYISYGIMVILGIMAIVMIYVAVTA